MRKIEIEWDAVTELVALLVLGLIAGVAMYKLGVQGKEIPLSIGSGIAGYLTKSRINAIREKKGENNDPEIT